ncbi:MAG: flagellar basal body P-ring formation chaperone FlgA [Planctomycetaceae bacterium]|jgi:flagella basal body P-ring formation protein FlgA|nr:flagellar basal body P-ring formation chaperone FlgA [Planctomycetaceae bacterium]
MNTAPAPSRLPLLAALATLLLLAVTAVAAGQNTVVLHPTASPPQRGVLRLEHVADIQGPDRDSLAAVSLGTPQASVSADDVLQALTRAGVNLGRVNLQGGLCELRSPAAEKPAPNAPARSTRVPPLTYTVAADLPEHTVRGSIARRLADLLSLPPQDVRITLEIGADLSWTDQAPPAEVTELLIQAVDAPTSPRVGLLIEFYAGDRRVRSENIAARVQVRRTAVVPSAAIDRNTEITVDAVRTEELWVAPGDPVSVRTQDVVGQLARRRLEPGRPITRSDLLSPVVINRGDLVWVNRPVGGMMVKVRARATAAARAGEPIVLQVEGSKRTFTARAVAPGSATLSGPADADPAPPADEPPTANPAPAPNDAALRARTAPSTINRARRTSSASTRPAAPPAAARHSGAPR